MSLLNPTIKSRISHFAIAAMLLGTAVAGQAAHADTLAISATSHTFYVSATNLYIRSGETVSFTHTADQGGNLNGILNGVALTGTYCVNLTNPISVGTYDATTVTHDGTTFGETMMHGGAISWLLSNYAATATTVDQQNGLQAAIWRAEYGSNFLVDGADNATAGNTTAMINAYNTYKNVLGTNTASVSDVYWFSPAKSTGTTPTTHRQGLVGYQAGGSTSSAVPEAGSAALILPALGLLGAIIARKRRTN